MIPSETPIKVLKYLQRLHIEKVLIKKYEQDKLIDYFISNNYLYIDKKWIRSNEGFSIKFQETIEPTIDRILNFTLVNDLQVIENYCNVFDYEKLLEVQQNRDKISNLSFQQILSQYFYSSKYVKIDSVLSLAIKSVLGIESYIEQEKEQQFISILYPRQPTKVIILCENKDRLKTTRHEFIEFWYVGGKNINQLQYTPKPTIPILYLCDWDYDGLNIFTQIKSKYFQNIKLFIPKNSEKLMVRQDEVKEHRSIWKGNSFFKYLSEAEKLIATILYDNNSIIEEQRIEIDDLIIEFNLT